jgi:hypothetical protein
MVGIGGGILLVPALAFSFGLSQHQAQGTTRPNNPPPIGLIAAWAYLAPRLCRSPRCGFDRSEAFRWFVRCRITEGIWNGPPAVSNQDDLHKRGCMKRPNAFVPMKLTTLFFRIQCGHSGFSYGGNCRDHMNGSGTPKMQVNSGELPQRRRTGDSPLCLYAEKRRGACRAAGNRTLKPKTALIPNHAPHAPFPKPCYYGLRDRQSAHKITTTSRIRATISAELSCTNMAQPLLVPAKHKAHRLPMWITESFDYAIVGDAVVGQGTQQPTILDPLHAIQHRFLEQVSFQCKSDHHCEFAAMLDKLSGPVHGIDDPYARLSTTARIVGLLL